MLHTAMAMVSTTRRQLKEVELRCASRRHSPLITEATTCGLREEEDERTLDHALMSPLTASSFSALASVLVMADSYHSFIGLLLLPPPLPRLPSRHRHPYSSCPIEGLLLVDFVSSSSMMMLMMMFDDCPSNKSETNTHSVSSKNEL